MIDTENGIKYNADIGLTEVSYRIYIRPIGQSKYILRFQLPAPVSKECEIMFMFPQKLFRV